MGYLKIYSPLSPQEIKQLHLREKYKRINPQWDDSLVLMCKLFQPFVKKGVKILDAGCGHGNVVVDEFKNQIKEAVGIDIDAKATEKNVCLDKIVIGNLEKLPFSQGEFDVVLSQWVLEHLENPAKVLAEIYRVLKPGGAFIFVTPYKNNYLFLIKQLLKRKTIKLLLQRFYDREEKNVFPGLYRANTPKILKKLLIQTGFKKKKLILNEDPSYLGVINPFLFSLGIFLEKIAALIPFPFTKMHILGVFIK